jgi:hypothetical protein
VAKTVEELEKLRKQLLGTITQPTNLVWQSVALDGGAAIEVSNPFMAQDLWVPVTAQEQWALAMKLKVFPLTRAVADQAHLAADAGGGSEDYQAGAYGHDFERFSQSLNAHSSYKTFYSTKLISGAHKLWLLSNGLFPDEGPKGMAVNFGFYTTSEAKAKGDRGGPGGPFLKGRFVAQQLGTAHSKVFSDYSQLLQFMRNYTAGSNPADLRAALLRGDAALWDERRKLRPELLPF